MITDAQKTAISSLVKSLHPPYAHEPRVQSRRARMKGWAEMSVGERINYRRAKRRMSVDRLAEHLGVSRDTVYRWMRDGKHIDKFAEVLGCTVDDLLGKAAL